MAKPFGKKPTHWLDNQATIDFISTYIKVRNRNFADLVIVKLGAPELGGVTWMHEDLAIDFAQWLNVAFSVWCTQKIKEIP